MAVFQYFNETTITLYALVSILLAAAQYEYLLYVQDGFREAVVALSSSYGRFTVVNVIISGFVLLAMLCRAAFLPHAGRHDPAAAPNNHASYQLLYLAGDFYLLLVINKYSHAELESPEMGLVCALGVVFLKLFHHLAMEEAELLKQAVSFGSRRTFRLCALLGSLLAVDVRLFMFFLRRVLETRGLYAVIYANNLFNFILDLSLNIFKLSHFVYETKQSLRSDISMHITLVSEVLVVLAKFVGYLGSYLLLVHRHGEYWFYLSSTIIHYNVLKKKYKDLSQFRRATANMDRQYPPATPAELARAGNLCVICREEMSEGARLACTHVLHQSCLRNWLTIQRVCPICRASVFSEPDPTPEPSTTSSSTASSATRSTTGGATGSATRGATHESGNAERIRALNARFESLVEEYRQLSQQIDSQLASNST